MTRGIDVSHGNGVIDWTNVDVDFAVIRAGRGTGVDRQWTANAAGAAKAGIPYGVYWFCYALTVEQATAEADCCIGAIKPHKLSLPVFYDFEYDTERYAADRNVVYTDAKRTAIIKAFCERIKAAGYTPGIYLNPDYIKSRLVWSELSGYPLWLAKWTTSGYTSYDNTSYGAVCKTYGQPLIWQFGRGKATGGIQTDIDLNYGYFTVPATNAHKTQPVTSATIVKGDTVKVINVSVSGGKTRGNTFTGGKFVVYFDTYDVLSVRDKRAVIGKNGKATAAVNIADLVKV